MSWYAIHPSTDRKAKGSVEVMLYDEIGMFGVTAKDFIAEIREHKDSHIDLRINSVGGSVIDGDAIFNALRRHKGGLTVHIDGLAASMASVIAMAGDTVSMADNALIMVHNPWSMSVGDAEDLRAEAEVLDKIKANMIRAYGRKTGLNRQKISDMMDDETWLNAEEAKELGFVDDIVEGGEAAASITIETARARFDTLRNNMAKPKNHKAEAAAAPEAPAETLETPVDAAPPVPVVDEPVVDTADENVTAELQARVEKLQAQLTEADEAFRAKADTTAAELEAAKQEVARLASEVASKDQELATLRAEQKSVGEQAAAIVGSLGISTDGTVAEGEAQPTAAQIFSQLEGPAATAFFRTHKAAIINTFSN
jgi:ATP-dependent Clp protease, protease subunit